MQKNSLPTIYVSQIDPRKKRNGKLIKRFRKINKNSDPVLCPVRSYYMQMEKVAQKLCLTTKNNNELIIVNELFQK
ncbi:hypothetical protein AYI68_g145 [Smittium mucronatum]|uniref:Uncharacterized protein n=1 Tax=Smittium mucronatum TaxID=133383 RepID=A0A1R0H971_9FUNG|nr:hypothetical protein AYI68_g145 [Smittium mucronatum]